LSITRKSEIKNRKSQNHKSLWGCTGFDSTGYGKCKHAVRWIIST